MRRESIELLKESIKINSTNPGEGEETISRFYKKILSENGIKASIITNEKGHQSVYAYVAATQKSETTLAFCGHMDTVPVGDEKWLYDPLGAEEKEGKIYGRGAADMKAGTLAMILSIVNAKKNDLLRNNIFLLLTGDEEVEMTGAQELAKIIPKDQIDLMIIGEPTSGYIGYVQKGVIGVRVTFEGKAAHSSAPEYGVNAIEHMNEVLHEIFYDKFSLPVAPHQVLGPVISNVTRIAGGTGLNIIPDQAFFEMEIRTLPNMTQQIIFEKFDEIINQVKVNYPNLKVDITILKSIPSVETDISIPEVEKFNEIYEKTTKKKPVYVGIPGATDAAMFRVPTLVVSFANPELAHQVNEYVTLKQFEKTMELYSNILETKFKD
ncbi:M20 family metallopeptidase [Enterococcus mundtii]|uniref:M20 family metallopeptidase n=1 Tax=Enterococcus mundtii TaxID=53346 RepID=UPI001377C96C|nr:M20 family metallopeptidase [Enterococcus mundtii]NBA63579.1 ArgE/DapE family deacylase [Enterococcus mundtii]